MDISITVENDQCMQIAQKQRLCSVYFEIELRFLRILWLIVFVTKKDHVFFFKFRKSSNTIKKICLQFLRQSLRENQKRWKINRSQRNFYFFSFLECKWKAFDGFCWIRSLAYWSNSLTKFDTVEMNLWQL